MPEQTDDTRLTHDRLRAVFYSVFTPSMAAGIPRVQAANFAYGVCREMCQLAMESAAYPETAASLDQILMIATRGE